MKSLILRAFLILFFIGSVRAAEENPATAQENSMSARFRDTRTEIDVLFGRRDAAAQAPDPRTNNPFRTTSFLPNTVAFNQPDQPATSADVGNLSDDAILNRIAAQVGFVGIIIDPTGKVFASTKTQSNYALGSRARVVVNGTTYYINILTANVNGVTIGLNQAQLWIPFYPERNRSGDEY